MPNQVTVRYGSKGAKAAQTDADKLRGKVERLQKTSAKGLISTKGAAVGLAAFSAVGLGIAKITSYLGDAAQAYRDDETSQAKLRTSLMANIPAYDGNARAIEKVLTERTKLGFSDDEQRESLSTLITRTHDSTEALRLQRIAMDLARLRGMSLGAATDLLGKAFSGQIGALRRAGIAVDANATATEALAAVEKAAAGQAEAYANTIEGKLVVSEVKAEEASEKFGKSVARLQADVLPLVSDAISGLADNLDALQVGFDESVPAIDRLEASLQGLNSNGIVDIIPGLRNFVDLMGEEATTAREAEEAERQHGDSLIGIRTLSDAAAKGAEDLANETENVEDTMTSAQIDARRFAGRLTAIEEAAKGAADEIEGLADTIADELFGDAINAGNEAAMKAQVADLIEQRKEAKKGSLEYIELTGEIAETRKALFEYHLEQAEKEGPQAAIAFLERERSKAGAARNEIDKLIQRYRTLAGMQNKLGPIIVPFGRYAGKSLGERASGGPVKANEPYIVGEDGPEIMVPNSSGKVIPNDAGGGGAVGGITNIFYISGVLSMTPGANDDLARKLEPLITRAQQRRGVVKRVA